MTNKDENRPGYDDKSRRIYAWSDLIKSFGKIVWLLLIIIVLAALGKMFLFKDGVKQQRGPIDVPVVEKIDWSKVNKSIEAVMVEARLETEKNAAAQLDLWIAENMERVDNDFLDWYFGYWTQQGLGLKALLAQVWHWVDSDSPSAAERVTLVVQEEFTNRVIRPQIAQLEMERIIKSIVSDYTGHLRQKLDRIPGEYKINPADWDRYITDVAVMVEHVEAGRSTPLTLKALVGFGARGTIAVLSALGPLITRIGSRMSTRFAARAAAKMAAKTGGKVAAKTGGKFLGTIIAVGIIIWDVWDHYSTKAKAKPVLRQNILDYLKEVKQAILHDPEFGIMTVIYQMEQGISKQNPAVLEEGK